MRLAGAWVPLTVGALVLLVGLRFLIQFGLWGLFGALLLAVVAAGLILFWQARRLGVSRALAPLWLESLTPGGQQRLWGVMGPDGEDLVIWGEFVEFHPNSAVALLEVESANRVAEAIYERRSQVLRRFGLDFLEVSITELGEVKVEYFAPGGFG